MSREDEKRKDKIIDANRNPDAITGQSGSHPIGTGLGAAAGGAATGAIAGALAGPVGAAVGAVVGGVAGGYAGKAMAEEMDPTVESAYWQAHYLEREYVDSELEYDHYEPAYRYGYESRSRFDHDDFAAVEKELAAC